MFPTTGVVCDQQTQRCYTANGLSPSHTGKYYGNGAQKNALRLRESGFTQKEFTLSTGSRCDIVRRVCFNEPLLNQRITQQLFAQGLTRQVDDRTNTFQQIIPNMADYTGECILTRDNLLLYQGACALREVREGSQPRFEVQLGNGVGYIFEEGRNGYQISDGNRGRWPVQFTDYGNSGLFRWADMSLTVTQANYRPESGTNTPFGRAFRNFLIDLFN